MELKYLNYDTTYSITINGKTTTFNHEACFSDVFHRMAINKDDICKYSIWINRSEEYVRKHNRDNFCFFDHKELYNHIKTVQRLFDFKFRIKETKDDFTVTVTIQAPLIYHKYILTWIRYAYEAPMNIMFLDINRLQKESVFRFVSKANLFLLLSYGAWSHQRRVHCIPRPASDGYKPGKFLSNKELCEQLKRESCLNDIYIGNGNYSIPKYEIPIEYVTNRDEIFDFYAKRLSLYVDIYLKYIK